MGKRQVIRMGFPDGRTQDEIGLLRLDLRSDEGDKRIVETQPLVREVPEVGRWVAQECRCAQAFSPPSVLVLTELPISAVGHHVDGDGCLTGRE